MKIEKVIEQLANIIFSDKFQAKAMIYAFGILGVFCLIGSFWNPYQLLFAAMCAAMVLCGKSELKKVIRNESEKRKAGKYGKTNG